MSFPGGFLVSREWNPNLVVPKPAPPVTRAQSAAVPATVTSIPPTRKSRVGPILFTLGVGLVSLNFFLSAWAFYVTFNSPSLNNFNWQELADALGEIFLGIGVVLGATGWLLGKREVIRFQEPATLARGATRRVVGQIVVIIGSLLICGATLYLGALELEAYWNVPINLATWVYTLILTVEGVGVLGVAAGWWTHHSGSTAL